MEWTGRQQIWFLLQSVIVGCLQGLILDAVSGFHPNRSGVRWIWTDVFVGPLFALITFMGALVIMDGQLHPLLLFGVFGGMFVQHILLGGMVCKCICKIRRWIRLCARGICGFLIKTWKVIHIRLFSERKTTKNDAN